VYTENVKIRIRNRDPVASEMWTVPNCL